MAEGLALAASVIAVLQITNSVLSVCYDYRAVVHGASGEFSKVEAEMKGLRDVLQTLEPLAKQAEFADPTAGTRLPTLTLLCGSQGLLQRCLDEVTRLDKRLKTPSWSDGFGPKRKAFIQALRWPLNKAETKEALVNIGRFKDTFNLAITADEVALILAIQDLSSSTNHIVLGTHKDVCSIKDTITGLSRDIQSTKDETLVLHRGMEQIEREERIYRWLNAPDPSTNHNRASRSRQANTGSWFLDSATFTHWKEQNSLVWLHGKPGCGKTVLSSTIINEVLQESRSKSDVAVAYFYFDFNDVEKQKPDKMIRSLITQLSRQSTKKLGELESLFFTCDNGGRQPEDARLMIVLKEAVKSFDETYIILDALDECSDTKELMESIEEVQGWQLSQLHMLTTSRKLKDIEDSLEPLIGRGGNICIQSTLVDADIRAYVGERLHNDRGLKRWRNMPQVQKEIETTLMKKADGMFRWAVCQLDAIQDCLRLPALREALTSLPRTLDETYSRILCNIPEERSQDAIKILQWLTYSARPVRVDELAEIVAVNTTGSPWFNCEDRFPEHEEVLTICSSLVTVEEGSMSEEDDLVGEEDDWVREKDDLMSEEDDLVREEDDLVSEEDDLVSEEEDGSTGDDHIVPIRVVRLAHFSVKEYLVSERIRNQATATARFAMQEIQANQSIAAACLAYLLQFDRHDSLTSSTTENFPLARYAAEYWMQHTRAVGKDLDPIKMLILEFCQVRREAYVNSHRLCDPERGCPGYGWKRKGEIASPLYYGSFDGVTELVRFLLEEGVDVNAQGGHFGNALQAASCSGHITVVQLLLEEGADINAQGGYSGNALEAASLRNHMTVVQLLLDKGAEVNTQGGTHGNALQAASLNGLIDQKAVVQLLLNKGADVNAQGGWFGNALQAACGGSQTMVQLLLDEGADVNAQGGLYGNALQKASFSGPVTVVQLLLNKGADVNAQGGCHGNALQAALQCNHETVVQLLLKEGADVNALQGEHDDNALETASCHGLVTVVQLLLKKGANVNAKGQQYGNALQAASYNGHETVVQLLLEKGADVNAEGGGYGNALQAAFHRGHDAVVQLLLKEGADVNALQGGHDDNGLQAASCHGLVTVVQLLLKKGADVNAKGGKYGNALQAASRYGHVVVVQLLLKEGADVNAKGGKYGNALQAASFYGYETVMQLLLENGADVHAKGGKYGSALGAALDAEEYYRGSEDEPSCTATVQLLRSAMESQALPSSPPTAEEATQLTQRLFLPSIPERLGETTTL